MATKKMKRYDRGGDVMETVDPEESGFKQRGLDASNKEPSVGFFERLRMGNIDDKNSEAYKRFGAGRGRAEMVPVEDRTGTPVSQMPVSSKVASVQEPSAPITSTGKPSAVYTAEDVDSVSTTPSPIFTPVAKSKPAAKSVAKPSMGGSKTSTTAEGMRGYKPSRENVEQPLTQEQLMAQIPTGGSGRNTTTGGSNSSEFSRRLNNVAMVLPGMGGIRAAQTAASAATAGRAARTAAAAKPAAQPAAKTASRPAAKTAAKMSKADKEKAKTAGELRSAYNPTNFRSSSQKTNAKNTRFKEDEEGVEFKRGGFVTRRGDGIAQRGRTKGVMR